MFNITTKSGKVYERHAWTGGDTPDDQAASNPEYQELVAAFLDEQIAECGGLDMWEPSTSAAERLAIFQNRANLDAWRTLNH